MIIRKVGVLLSAMLIAAVGIVITGTPAMAANKWTIYHSAGDMPGAHASGTLDYNVNGNVYVTGTLTDTTADGSSACFQLKAYFSFSQTVGQWESRRVGGKGNKVTFGIIIDGSATDIRVREGLTNYEGGCVYADGWVRIYA
jgi:hypothetical protein